MELVYSKETKIKNLSSGDDIIQMLNYLYVLLNVKKENQLNQIEESVLNGFIVNNYKNFTIDEIKHAFRLAIAGQLGIEMFQKLDAITFGKVLLSYNEFKNNKIRQHIMKKKKVKKEVTVQERTEIEQEFIDKCIKPYFDRRKEMTEPEVSHGNKAIFDHYYNSGFIKMSEKEKDNYRTIAKKLWLIDRREKGEKVDFESPIGNRGMILFMSCIALYYKTDEILKNVEIDFKGWNDKL